MFRLIALLTLIPIYLTLASSEDSYDDEPILYMDARTPKYRSKPLLLQNKDSFYRYARGDNHEDDVLRLITSNDDESEFEEFNNEFARPTRSQEKSDNFVRFGRGNSDFVRFGRDPYKYKDQNFLRFGRGVLESEVPKTRSRREAVQEGPTAKRNDRDNFLRFGRGGDDSFIRYGRNHGGKINQDPLLLPIPTKSQNPFGSEQFGNCFNGRSLRRDSPLLSILRKLDEMRVNT